MATASNILYLQREVMEHGKRYKLASLVQCIVRVNESERECVGACAMAVHE